MRWFDGLFDRFSKIVSLPPVQQQRSGVSIVGTFADDELHARKRADVLDGRAGDDHLSGRAGSDVLFGRAGDDVLLGGRGDDLLHGGRGHDLMVGGEGRDVIVGAAGDTALGGAGADTFIFSGSDNEAFGMVEDALKALHKAHPKTDTVVLDFRVFGDLGSHISADELFIAGKGHREAPAGTHLSYDHRSGLLSYDGAGNGKHVVEIGTIDAGLHLTADNFLVLA
jgi:Ca2+-binding RTX toxin-like protein